MRRVVHCDTTSEAFPVDKTFESLSYTTYLFYFHIVHDGTNANMLRAACLADISVDILAGLAVYWPSCSFCNRYQWSTGCFWLRINYSLNLIHYLNIVLSFTNIFGAFLFESGQLRWYELRERQVRQRSPAGFGSGTLQFMVSISALKLPGHPV